MKFFERVCQEYNAVKTNRHSPAQEKITCILHRTRFNKRKQRYRYKKAGAHYSSIPHRHTKHLHHKKVKEYPRTAIQQKNPQSLLRVRIKCKSGNNAGFKTHAYSTGNNWEYYLGLYRSHNISAIGGLYWCNTYIKSYSFKASCQISSEFNEIAFFIIEVNVF